MEPLKVLDLFSGLGGFSVAFKEYGHVVCTVDFDSKFTPDIVADIMTLRVSDLNPPYDIVLASPPCQCFSIASCSTHWVIPGFPKTQEAKDAIQLVYKTLELIDDLNPKFWIMENPRGMLRKILKQPKATITLCQYGDTRMKPTDLWGNFPDSIIRPKCKNGDSCHVRAPRGSKTPGSTQGYTDKAVRALIPRGLSEAILKSVMEGL